MSCERKSVPENRWVEKGDVERQDGMKMIRKDETIFAAYDKVEMRKAKILIVANSDFVHTSKFLFWPDVIMLAAVDSEPNAVGVNGNRDTTTNENELDHDSNCLHK